VHADGMLPRPVAAHLGSEGGSMVQQAHRHLAAFAAQRVVPALRVCSVRLPGRTLGGGQKAQREKVATIHTSERAYQNFREVRMEFFNFSI
jgi:hypothetical protein